MSNLRHQRMSHEDLKGSKDSAAFIIFIFGASLPGVEKSIITRDEF